MNKFKFQYLKTIVDKITRYLKYSFTDRNTYIGTL